VVSSAFVLFLLEPAFVSAAGSICSLKFLRSAQFFFLSFRFLAFWSACCSCQHMLLTSAPASSRMFSACFSRSSPGFDFWAASVFPGPGFCFPQQVFISCDRFAVEGSSRFLCSPGFDSFSRSQIPASSFGSYGKFHYIVFFFLPDLIVFGRIRIFLARCCFHAADFFPARFGSPDHVLLPLLLVRLVLELPSQGFDLAVARFVFVSRFVLLLFLSWRIKVLIFLICVYLCDGFSVTYIRCSVKCARGSELFLGSI
jgi:hypothetical protein